MTDLEIIKRIRAGHTKAYYDLVEQYQQRVYAAVWRCVASDEAQEIAEESLVRAYESIGNVSREDDFPAYLFRAMLDAMEQASVTYKNIEVMTVYARIMQLDFKPRRALILRSIYGFTYEQIVQKSQITLDELQSDLAQAREMLVGVTCCESYRKRIQAYIDNEMVRMERMVIEAHAEECDNCRRFITEVDELFGVGEYIEIPGSFAQAVMDRVEIEYEHENELSTGQKREQLAKKIEKNQNLRLWILVGCVLLFGLFSWVMSLMAGNNLAHTAPSIEQGETGEMTQDSFSVQLAQAIGDADAIFVEFGMNRVGVTEQPMIMMVADYIAKQPAQEYQGAAVSNSIGKITMKPSPGYDIIITAEHRLLIDDGKTIWELQTTRERLLDVLKTLGI